MSATDLDCLSYVNFDQAIKLDLSSTQLYGREKEQELLQDLFGNVEAQSTEFVVIVGPSGFGKTALIQDFQKSVDCFFCEGTFRQQTSPEPFEGIVEALSKLCDYILRENDKLRVSRIKEYLQSEIGEQLQEQDRTSIIPQLGQILGFSATATAATSTRKITQREKSEYNTIACEREPTLCSANPTGDEIQQTFCALLKAAADNLGKPIVIALENLQFSDSQAIDLLKHWVEDSELRRVMFVATYRNVDIQDGAKLEFTESKEWDMDFFSDLDNFTEMPLRSLKVDSINNFLADVTCRHEQDTLKLAALVQRKTKGNCIFLREFLATLQEQNLLLYSLQTNRWEWSLERIESETSTTDNVAAIVVERIQRLSRSAQNLLKVASCFGLQFDIDLVQKIVSSNYLDKRTKPAFKDLSASSRAILDTEVRLPRTGNNVLTTLIDGGYLEKGGGQLMKFCHLRIQKVAYSMIENEEKKDDLHLKIGKLLYEQYRSSASSQKWQFFAAVDQLNRGSHRMDNENRLELAKLNLEAGQLAKSKSAFKPAARYLDCGIVLVSYVGKWKQHYRLTLELCTLAAEMEQIIGHVDRCERFGREVVDNAKTTRDKMRAYVALIHLYGSHGMTDACLRLGIKVLKETGIVFPSKKTSPVTARFEVTKTKLLFRGKTDEELLDGENVVTDSVKLDILNLLSCLGFYCLFSEKMNIIVQLICSKLAQLSLQEGMSSYSPAAWASYGLLLNFLGDFKAGCRFGLLALKRLDDCVQHLKPHVLTIVHSLIYHWKYPLRKSLDPLLQAYTIGMYGGGIGIGLAGAGAYCNAYIQSGLPLLPISIDLKRYVNLAREYNKETASGLLVPLWQYVLNLMGQASDPLVLTGEAMEQTSFIQKTRESGNEIALRNIYIFQSWIAFAHEEYERAEHLMSCAKEIKGFPSHFQTTREVFFEGLNCLMLHQKNRKKKKPVAYRLRAKRLLKQLECWTREGNVNCLELYMTLKAQLLASKRSSDYGEVRTAFDEAILASTRTGSLHGSALANRLLGMYCFQREDDFWAHHYLQEAHSLHTQRGAHAIVSFLESKYEFLQDCVSSCDSHGTTYQGRERFDKETAERHHRLSFLPRVSFMQVVRKLSLTPGGGVPRRRSNFDVVRKRSRQLSRTAKATRSLSPQKMESSLGNIEEDR